MSGLGRAGVEAERRVLRNLKREATRMKKSTGVKHTTCLALVSQKYGFRDWHHVCSTDDELISNAIARVRASGVRNEA